MSIHSRDIDNYRVFKCCSDFFIADFELCTVFSVPFVDLNRELFVGHLRVLHCFDVCIAISQDKTYLLIDLFITKNTTA